MPTRISRRATSPPSSWSGTIIRRSDIRGICLILDRDLLRIDPVDAFALAHAVGVRFFQYRSKTETRREIYETCVRLSRVAREKQALFIVNDHADIAVAVDADGVHLGQDDLPIEEARKLVGMKAIIGISTHSHEQAVAAEQAGADYIGFGPVFQTATKDAGRTQGVDRVRTIKNAVSIPLVAIGGINQENVREVISAGADAAAVISAVLSAPDFSRAASELVALTSNV